MSAGDVLPYGKRGRSTGRRDTYIGLIDTRTWRFYLAPCYGVDWQVIKGVPIDLKVLPSHLQFGEIGQRRYLLQAGLFPKDTPCVATSTSDSSATVISATKDELDKAYGATAGFNPVCYVGLGESAETQFPTGAAGSFPKFDGKSHQALAGWCRVHAEQLRIRDIEGFWFACLGFAIQRDKSGYYIRFASALNVEWGQPQGGYPKFATHPVEWRAAMRESGSPQNTFQLRTPAFAGRLWDAEYDARHDTKELRDMPKQWAALVEDVLARDLKLSVLRNPRERFETMVSRGEAQLTKLSRFIPTLDLNRASASLNDLTCRDVSEPGSFGTSNSLI